MINETLKIMKRKKNFPVAKVTFYVEQNKYIIWLNTHIAHAVAIVI